VTICHKYAHDTSSYSAHDNSQSYSITPDSYLPVVSGRRYIHSQVSIGSSVTHVHVSLHKRGGDVAASIPIPTFSASTNAIGDAAADVEEQYF
jgi:hypothetical protein